MERKRRGQKFKWILSAVVFVALIAVSNVEGIIKAGIGIVLLAAAGILLPGLHADEKITNWKTDICALLICALAGVRFYSMWMPSSMMAGIANSIHLNKESFLAIAACIGSLLALYAVRSILYAGLDFTDKIEKRQRETVPLHDVGYRIPKKSYVFLLITAALIITICSKSSPLYPLNDWVDANCFFTVGKSMLHGKVLYRDIVEQKGFYLYVIHALAYLMSHTSFFGVYLLEIASAFAFLVYAYKIALLFCSDADVLYLIPVLAALIYGTYAFAHGDSAEEFCLPLLTYALWVGIKALRNGETPKKGEFFIIGVTSGCVLWIKYTMLGFYLGWFIVPACLMIRKHAWKKLGTSIAAIALGVCAATLPVIVYFAANGALHDLWEIYFYDNIFIYSQGHGIKHSILENIIRESLRAIRDNRAISIMIFLGLFWFGTMKKGAVFAQVLCSMVCTAALVYCGNESILYYTFIFSAFVPVVLPMMEALSAYGFHKQLHNKRLVFTASGVILAIILNNNAYMLRLSEADLPQFAFMKYVDQVENPTLLNYGSLDLGFYTVYDIVPHCKYFCKLNIQLDEMIESQNDYLEQGISDFVVTIGRKIESELYECVAETEYLYENRDMAIYRMYALKTLNIDLDI